MPTIKQYEHSGNPPIPDELATCIAFLQAAKLRAEAHICNPLQIRRGWRSPNKN